VILLLSKPVVREYRAVLTGRDVMQRQPAITPERVGIVLLRLQYVSAYLRRVGAQFSLARDSQDEKFIELAIAGNATHLLSFDNDLLSLPSGRNDDAKRFRQRLPRILVQSPDEFVNSNRELFEGQ
jgi:putative PIN family toxin of toxin-antitoxin system